MSERIEVAQVVTRFIAGAGGVALRGAQTLDPARFHVTIVTGQGGPLTETAERAGMDVLVEPSLVAPLDPRHDVLALHRLTALFRERAFDVVHTHSAKSGALGRLAAHRAGVPAIVHTYHGFPFHDFQSSLRRNAYVAIERRLARITDVVLAIGSGVATEALIRGLADPGNLRTVTPVVDGRVVRRTPSTCAAARETLGVGRDRRVVGTVGRLDFQKAPEHFVEAVAALPPDVVGVWIGSGPLADEVAALVRARGLGDRFVLAGERRDVSDLLPAFDVFAMASRYEGLPCAIVEAMRCGVPVVATAVNSVSDVVVPGETGLLVPAARPALLARAIERLLDDPVLSGQMVARAQQRAAAPYDAEQLGVVLDEVYTNTLRENLTDLARAS